jgi:hypothetical protein
MVIGWICSLELNLVSLFIIFYFYFVTLKVFIIRVVSIYVITPLLMPDKHLIYFKRSAAAVPFGRLVLLA